MFISVVSKNGMRVSEKNSDKVFKDKEQHDRFYEWAWQVIPYAEAKERVENLGYVIREDDEIPETISRFAIWRRVSPGIRKPELVEFEGMKLKIKVL